MISLSGPGQFTYDEALEKGLVEPGIKPVCDALYKLGCTPLASCEGHPEPRTWLSFLIPFYTRARPYVLFSAEINVARAIEKNLRVKHALWNITGTFHPASQELLWSIESIHIDYLRGDVTRERINKDLKELSCVLNDFGCCN